MGKTRTPIAVTRIRYKVAVERDPDPREGDGCHVFRDLRTDEWHSCLSAPGLDYPVGTVLDVEIITKVVKLGKAAR
jgi:hypothetical protein